MSATPERVAEKLEALSKAAFGGDWTVCTEEFGAHKGAVYIHAHDVDADEEGLVRDYGKRICDMADNDDDEANAELIAFIGNFARSIARAIRAQSERERVLVEALEQIAQWDISGPPLTKNDANIPTEDFPHYVAGRAHAELALIRNYARNSIARAALKAAP